MISLLNNTSRKINIYVIHNEDNFKSKVPIQILKHKNLIIFESYKFEDYNYDFPNIKNVHISVATYFRLFIQNYRSSPAPDKKFSTKPGRHRYLTYYFGVGANFYTKSNRRRPRKAALVIARVLILLSTFLYIAKINASCLLIHRTNH